MNEKTERRRQGVEKKNRNEGCGGTAARKIRESAKVKIKYVV